MRNSTVFSRLMDEYGSLDQDDETEKKTGKKEGAAANTSGGIDDKKEDAALMQEEERNTGSVTWAVYAKYLHFAGGIVWAPIIVLLLTLSQGAQGTIHSSVFGMASADLTIFSWEQPVPRVLDCTKYSWVPTRRLYGGLCSPWWVWRRLSISEAHLILQVLHKQFSHSYSALVLRTCRRSHR